MVPGMDTEIHQRLRIEQKQEAIRLLIPSMILWSDGLLPPKTLPSVLSLMDYRHGAGIQSILNRHGTNNQNRMSFFRKNGPITFFEKPVTTTNTVAIDKSTEFSTVRLSYTNYYSEGLLPNSSLKKDNFNVNGTWNITKKLTATASANYIKQRGKGRNATGYNGKHRDKFPPVATNINSTLKT